MVIAAILVSVPLGIALPSLIYGVANKINRVSKNNETAQGCIQDRQNFRDAVTKQRNRFVFRRIPAPSPIPKTRPNEIDFYLERKNTFQKKREGMRDGYEA